MATSDGHANLKSWCDRPWYADTLVQECLVKKDLYTHAHKLFEFSVKAGMGELDGSYCFIEGYCVSDATLNTTMQEAEQLCDRRFGHKVWAQFASKYSPPEDRIGAGGQHVWSPKIGFTNKAQTRPFVLAACAMGNYHCDAAYCKETYCKNEYYQKRYGHFLHDYNWVKPAPQSSPPL